VDSTITSPIPRYNLAVEFSLAHSPDADDAFMFFALASGHVDTGGLTFRHILKDIQTLNAEAQAQTYDITALSVAAYPMLAAKYQLLTSGASMGDGYGPIIVSAKPMAKDTLAGARIAIPGMLTSAHLALRIYMQPDEPQVEAVYFEDIGKRVLAGDLAAGVLIHEGQLTYAAEGLHCVEDLGVWWKRKTGLPLPLGVNAVKRSLPADIKAKLAAILRESIRYSLEHRQEALDYALSFGRGLERGKADKFVGMYVNDWTLDLGQKGKDAVKLFLKLGYPDMSELKVDFAE
jgi:1,4-dihydroxy-6-naphthoate synthase